MKFLTVNDLNTTIDSEPRVSHRQLAVSLGFIEAHKFRHLIERNAIEFERYGRLSSTVDGTTGGRPGTVLWLNEPQAILAAVRSEAPRAADVRHEIITVFMAHRYGRLANAATPADNLIARLEEILDIDERARKLDTAVAMVDDMQRQADAHASSLRQTATAMRRMLAGPSVQPIQPHGIRRIVDATHRRQVGMEMLAAGTDPHIVAREIGIQEQTARKWLKGLRPTNDN